jgi:hypothetical protein
MLKSVEQGEADLTQINVVLNWTEVEAPRANGKMNAAGWREHPAGTKAKIAHTRVRIEGWRQRRLAAQKKIEGPKRERYSLLTWICLLREGLATGPDRLHLVSSRESFTGLAEIDPLLVLS